MARSASAEIPRQLRTGRTLVERLARIHEECLTPLGYAIRGVTSWEQEKLIEWMKLGPREVLSLDDELSLMAIERQVFGG